MPVRNADTKTQKELSTYWCWYCAGFPINKLTQTSLHFSHATLLIRYENRNEVPPPNTTCCVSYSYPYCGIPSGCNQYLKCIDDTETAVPLPSSADLDGGNFTGAFEALADCDAEPGTKEFRACLTDLLSAKATTMSDTTSGGFAVATGALAVLATFGALFLN